jgi:hypothetical protein
MLAPNVYFALFTQTNVWVFFVGVMVIPGLFLVQAVYPVWLSRQQKLAEREFKKNSIGPSVLRREPSSSQLSNSQDISEDSRSSTSLSRKPWTKGTMEDVLYVIGDAEGRQCLLSFLEKELSVENLLFCEVCTDFESKYQESKSSQEADIVQEAKEITARFIHLSSPSCVNVSASTRRDILQKMSMLLKSSSEPRLLVSKNLFSKAKKEILLLITKDSFLRFRCSPEYREWTLRCQSPQVAFAHPPIKYGSVV